MYVLAFCLGKSFLSLEMIAHMVQAGAIGFASFIALAMLGLCSSRTKAAGVGDVEVDKALTCYKCSNLDRGCLSENPADLADYIADCEKPSQCSVIITTKSASIYTLNQDGFGNGALFQRGCFGEALVALTQSGFNNNRLGQLGRGCVTDLCNTFLPDGTVNLDDFPDFKRELDAFSKLTATTTTTNKVSPVPGTYSNINSRSGLDVARPSSPEVNDTHAGLSTGMIAGIAVGGILIITTLAVVCHIFCGNGSMAQPRPGVWAGHTDDDEDGFGFSSNYI